MVAEVRTFTVTVPAGTLAASPQVTPLTMPARVVRAVKVRTPPGPRGQVGWALGASGVQVVPWAPGTWIVADDETYEWHLERQITSGAWQLRAYNVGAYAHTLFVTFSLDMLPSAGGLGVLTAPLELESEQ